MFTHREAQQVAPNVFQITLWNNVKEEEPSFFVVTSSPSTVFTGDCACGADATAFYYTDGDGHTYE